MLTCYAAVLQLCRNRDTSVAAYTDICMKLYTALQYLQMYYSGFSDPNLVGPR